MQLVVDRFAPGDAEEQSDAQGAMLVGRFGRLVDDRLHPTQREVPFDASRVPVVGGGADQPGRHRTIAGPLAELDAGLGLGEAAHQVIAGE